VTEATDERWWPVGAATGIGAVPGTDPLEAARLVLGELPDLPHLPELPDRGMGSDFLPRGALFLADLHVDWQPAGWRLIARPGTEERRARDLLNRDLDAFEEVAGAYPGPVKVQVAGPWSLAAGLELPRGDKVLRDAGAVRDLGVALAEGFAAHLGDLHRRLRAATILVQLDEPALPAVLAGRLTTASGFGALPAPEPADVVALLRQAGDAIAASGGVPLVHCPRPNPPIGLLAAAGAWAVALDAGTLGRSDDDPIGEYVEAGGRLLLGLVPTTFARPGDPAAPTAPSELAAPAIALWRRLGFDPRQLAEVVAVTPAGGLGGRSPAQARAAMTAAREVARVLAEAPEGAG
jgi:hypothetical protein